LSARNRYLSLFFLFVLFFAFSGAFLCAQNINWEIKRHNTHLESLKAEVTDFMQQGYVPMGLSYDNVELYILYVKGLGQEVEGWLIEWYQNRDELLEGISGEMKKGYLPTGIAYVGDTIYVLFIHSKNTATNWRIEPSETDLRKVQEKIQPWVSQGYFPMDITANEDTYVTLLVELERTVIKSWTIERYEVGAHGDAINAKIREGYIPWGIMVRGNVIDILFVGI
jgi:hypothetical protein